MPRQASAGRQHIAVEDSLPRAEAGRQVAGFMRRAAPDPLTREIGNPSLRAVESGLPAITARTAKTRRFPHDYVLGRTDREVSRRTDREVWPEADVGDGPDREDAAAADVAYRRYPSTSAPPRRPASDHCRRPDTAVQNQGQGQGQAKTETKPKTETKKSENRFFHDVEGLRGIAVALVVLFHAGVPHMAGGFVGVDVFFVISGFLITGLLLREYERNGRVSFRGFYARRARRIIPPAAVAIVATSIAVWFLMPLLSVFRQALDLLAAAMNIANWRFIAAGKDYLAGASDDSVATHFWSLSIEEQFYFVWPLLLVALAVLAKRMRWSIRMVVGWGIAVVTAASLFGSLLFTASDPTLSYMATHTRAWQFGVGALVAVVGPLLTGLMTKLGVQIAMWVLGWAGLSAVLVTTVAYDHTTPYPGCGRVGTDARCRRDHCGRTGGRQQQARRRMVSLGAPVAVAGQGLLRLVSVALARSGAVQELHPQQQLADAGGRDHGGTGAGVGLHRAAGTPDHVVGGTEAQPAGLAVGRFHRHHCGRRGDDDPRRPGGQPGQRGGFVQSLGELRIRFRRRHRREVGSGHTQPVQGLR